MTERPKVSGLAWLAAAKMRFSSGSSVLIDVLRKDRQRLAADVGGEVGAAEHRAERHQEDREGKQREDQRKGDGARHHDAVVAEEPVGGVVQDGPDRPRASAAWQRASRQEPARAPPRVQARYRPCRRFERLRAAANIRRRGEGRRRNSGKSAVRHILPAIDGEHRAGHEGRLRRKRDRRRARRSPPPCRAGRPGSARRCPPAPSPTRRPPCRCRCSRGRRS